ncbi:hypothetical protein EJB05_00786, partial [Eragrostis curvula]
MPPGPTSIHDVTDDLLELILLQVSSAVCLVHAAATCMLWCHVIAGAGFLRRFRSLHGTHVLGCYHIKYGQDIFVPAAVPPGIDDRRRLSLSLDFHPYSMESNELFPCSDISTFLLDVDADEETDTSPLMSRFRVLHVRVHHYIDVQIYMFCTRDEQWVLLSSTTARDIVSAVMGLDNMDFLGRTGSYIFWGIPQVKSNVLILDECTGGFSVIALLKPMGRRIYYCRMNLRVISGDAHTVRFIRITGDDLEVLTVVRNVGTCVVDSRVVGLLQLSTIEVTRSRWNFMDTAPAVGH